MLKKLMKILLSFVMVLSLVLTGTTTVHAATSEQDIATIKTRLKEYFLEQDTIDDGAKVETCYVSKAKDYFKLMKDDGSFDDVDYESTQNANSGRPWDPYLALDRLQAMAIAYHKKGNDLYQNKEVVDKLNKALVHWQNVKPTNDNWWEIEIGVQLRFARIGLFMDGIMSDDAIDFMLESLIKKAPDFRGNSGQNYMWYTQNHIYYHLMKGNANGLRKIIDKHLSNCLTVQTDDGVKEAIQVDNSFYMHGKQFYSNGYGLSMFRDMSFWIYMFRDTQFSLGQDVIDRMANYMIKGTSWTIRGDIIELYLGYRPYNHQVGYKNYASAYIEPLERMIASDSKHAVQYQMILDNITGKISSNGKDGNYYMWRSGYASHMRDNYGVNIKMDSKELIGGEWRGSWPKGKPNYLSIYWTSSAASTISVDGDEYTNVFPTYDWTHTPGTTTPTMMPTSHPKNGRFRNGTSFTIGVNDGKYGNTAYKMNKYGTTVNKGYFFFDNEFIALGSGISSTNDNPIHTTLNQVEAENLIVDGQSVTKGSKNTYTPKYIYNGKVGYIIPDNQSVTVSYDDQKDVPSLWSEEEKEKLSNDIFTAWIDHGKKPKNASYSYIVVPGKTVDEVKAYADNVPITIVSNTNDVQAVRHDGLKQTQINFYKAGSLEYKKGHTVTVDHPCSLIIDESGNERKVTVAVNEDEGYQNVNVTVNDGQLKTLTHFISSAVPYAGQPITLTEGTDNRYHVSSYTQGHSVTSAFDKDEKTYWESQTNHDEWISFYTGNKKYVSDISVLWGEQYASAYDVYVSQDGRTYEKLTEITNGNGREDIVSINGVYSYIKIVMKDGNNSHFQIKEISFETSDSLALNKSVDVSSTSAKDTGNVKELAVDGNRGTRWSSARDSDNEWIVVDLGKYSQIDALSIKWEGACSDNYTIEVSSDNKTWEEVKENLKTDSSLLDEYNLKTSAYGRYVKIHSTKSRNKQYGISIYEIDIYGKHTKEDIALKKDVIASSTQDSNVSTNVIDNKDDTKWISKTNQNEWIYIDLGGYYKVSDMDVVWGENYATSYDVEVSQDKASWKKIKSITYGHGGTENINGLSEDEVRCVRLKFNASQGDNYQISSWNIYGEKVRDLGPESFNISLNKPVKVSSISANDSSMVGEKAVDGDLKTRWGSLRGEHDNWIIIDLEQYSRIDKVRIDWEAACSDDYTIEVSNDGTTWNVVTEARSNPVINKHSIDEHVYDDSVYGRYVKVHSYKSRNVKFGINIFEISVWGDKTDQPIQRNKNIALNKPSKASSTYKIFDSSRAFDGRTDGNDDNQSRWVSLRKKENTNKDIDYQWIYVDLENIYDINKVVLNWEGACATDYKVQVSNNAKNWKDVAHITDGKFGIRELSFDDVQGRYVRVECLNPTGQYGYSLWEFEVYGQRIKTPAQENLALNKSSNASSEFTDPKDGQKHYESSLAFDGKTDKIDGKESRWVSNRDSNDEWIYVDLEDYYNISKVVLNWEGAGAKEYKVQTSLDGQEWIDVTHQTDGKGGRIEHKYTNVMGRYVRMQGIKVGSKYGYSLWEFEVYGEKVDNQELKVVYNLYKYFDTSDYTPNSVSLFNKTLENVKGLLQETNTESIAKALQEMNKVIEGLTLQADFEVLGNLIQTVNSLDSSLYIPQTWKVLEDAKNKAIVINEDKNSSQEVVDEAYRQLKSAYDNLVKTADKTQLEELLNKASQIDRTKYVESSLKLLDETVLKAENVCKDPNASEEVVQDIYNELDKVLSNILTKKDFDTLQCLVKKASEIDKDIYISETVDVLEKALVDAQKVLEKEIPLSDEVNAMITKLNNALDNLVKKVDKSALQEIVQNAEKVEASLYTESSLKIFEKALKEAKIVLGQDMVSQKDVDKAVKTLQKAMDSLVKQADKTQLIDMLKKVGDIVKDNYTKESVDRLTKALVKSNKIVNDTNVSQDEVDQLCQELKEAYDALEKKEIEVVPEEPNTKPENNQKPNRSETDSSKNVQTSDESFIKEFLLMAILSGVGAYVVLKRKKDKI